MSSITEYFKQSELALAAYANLIPGVDPVSALLDNDMSSIQATVFAATWSVVTQYTDPITGVSATVFQEIATGKKTLAIRGTQGPTDYLADYLILNGTPSQLNPQYAALKAQVSAWLDDLTLTQGFTVTGHSLGGYLAAGLVADFGTSISHAYLYNAPGNNSLVSQIMAALGIIATPDASKISSLRADAGISPIAALGNDFSTPISVVIENQFLSDVSSPPDSLNHSQRVLTDSLALYSAYAQLDPTASVTSITDLIKASSNLNGNTLELALDNLRELLLGATVAGTPPQDRESYYTNLNQLSDWLNVRSTAGTAQPLKLDALTSLGGTAIASKAQTNAPGGLAYRYALAVLNPFAVTGDASIYASHNINGELDRYDPLTGTGVLTDQYLEDRAKMLSWKMQFDIGARDDDGLSDDFFRTGDKSYNDEWDRIRTSGDWDFIDQATGIKLSIDGFDLTTAANHQIVFGSSNVDSLLGDELSDNLYGGGGDDVVDGGNGADWLEGNAGDDTIHGGFGNDVLAGGTGFDTYRVYAGEGYDTVLDSDGSGVVKFGALEAKGSTGLDPMKWIHAAGSNTWVDQQNGITYTRSLVDGEIQLLIHKGDSNVVVKGWSDGELGIALGAGSAPPEPAALLTGDATADYLEAASGGQRVEGLNGADMILGSGFGSADHLLGGDGADWIVGNGGADLIEGGLGNDYINGIDGNSQAYGGDGNDLITAAAVEGVQLLNIGNVDIPGLTADIVWADAKSGFGMSAYLTYDSAGNLDLGHGSVPLSPYGGASALGGGWSFSMAFGGGTWNITYTHPTLAPAGKTPTGFWEHFIISGSSLTEGVFLFGEAGDDLIVGNEGADYLDGGSGMDQLFGHAGSDVLDGGTENDTLAGGDGQDILLGGEHNDDLYGEQQDDVLIGGTGDDVLWGDSPNPQLAAWDGNDYMDGGDGDDEMGGGGGADILIGGQGGDTLWGGSGNDILDGGAGADYLEGGTGDDTYLNVTGEDSIFDIDGDNNIQLLAANGVGAGGLITSATPTNGVSVDIALDSGDTLRLDSAFYGMSATLQFANGDVLDLETLVGETLTTPLNLTNDDHGGRVYGGAGNDVLTGGMGADTLAGHKGGDVLRGGDGNDTLDGGDGGDNLQGGAGDDVLLGGAGGDALLGGGGSDIYQFGFGDGSDIVYAAAPGDISTDVLQLGQGIAQADVEFVKLSDGGLMVRILSTQDALKFEGWFTNGPGVAAVRFGDSNELTATAVGGLAVVGFGGTVLDDQLVGTTANDRISGYGGNDTLDGGAGGDELLGGEGDDWLVGGTGNDIAYGGRGNDTYRLTKNFYGETTYREVDQIVEYENEGTDTMLTMWGGTLPDNVENMNLNDGSGSYATFNVSAIGNDLDNILIGRSAGVIGQDVLDGKIGADTMYATGGIQLIYVDNPGDRVIGQGYEIRSSIDYALLDPSGSWVPGFTNGMTNRLALIGSAAVNGTGNVLNNVLLGNLNTATNTLAGGLGDDIFIIDLNDRVVEAVGEGSDSAYVSLTAADFGREIRISDFGFDNIENYGLAGSADNVTLRGDAGDNELRVELNSFSSYRANLRGEGGNDRLIGGATGEVLDGGTGADYMTGGSGNDVYIVDSTGDQVLENLTNYYSSANSWDYQPASGWFSRDGGIDTVQSSITYSLGANVENLTLTDTAVISGTGNELNNVLTGNGASNVLTGGAGGDILKGGATGTPVSATVGSLVIYARGTPVLDVYPIMQVYVDGVLIQEFTVNTTSYSAYTVDPAKLGMAAGKVDVVFSNDAYRPDIGQDRNLYVQKIEVNGLTMNATDSGVFYDPGSGAAALDGLSLRLGQEALASNGALRFTLADNDTLDGGTGADQMSGGSGNDSYVVDNVGDVLTELPNEGVDTVRSSISHTLGTSLENLVLTGSTAVNGSGNVLNNLLIGNAGNNILYGDAGVDTLFGYAGNDRLDGGAGNDILQGGQGNDTYVIDSIGDSLWESANQGRDTVESAFSYTLGVNFESLILTGAAAINGTGNSLDNTLTGNSANNLLTGGAGNDTLDGGGGADSMIGGTGDDYYVLDNAGDIVTEKAGEGGADSVNLYLNADYTLGAEIEYFYRYGSGDWTTTGNAADNYIYGNGGTDTLIGLDGNDLLWGDVGADTLIGGVGDDRYYVDNASDVVTEVAGEGVDTVYVFGSMAHTLADNVENGSRMFWAGSLTGNGLDNSLDGSWDVDILDGGAGADTLTGFAGADTLAGGSGNDTYRLGRDYGTDTVVESDATAGHADVAQFLSGVAADQIWFRQVDNNLEASIIGTQDKLVIKDWYLGTDNHVEQFKTADGAMTLLDSNVQNLVNAMASFAPPAAGQTTLPQNYQDALAGVIAANWQ